MAHVRAVIADVYQYETPEALRADGIDVFPGAARFVDPHTLVAGEATLTARHFLIATGAHPFIPPIAGLDGVESLTYESIWDLEALPEHLLVVGAGASGIPAAIAAFIIQHAVSPWAFLLFVNVLLYFVGDFMEPSSAILILAPLFLPIVKNLGIDPIHFGIVMTVNMEIGMITPPVGLNLFVASGISGMSLMDVFRGAAPFMVIMLIGLVIITYIPIISLWFPKLIYGLLF